MSTRNGTVLALALATLAGCAPAITDTKGDAGDNPGDAGSVIDAGTNVDAGSDVDAGAIADAGTGADAASADGGTTSSTISGTAATGAPIAGGRVTAKCVGHPAEVETTSAADGHYAVAVAGPPCALKVTFGSPAQELYSYATAAGTANLTPLTQLVVAAMAKTSSKAFYDAFPGTETPPDAAAVVAGLYTVRVRLATFGVAINTLDPMGASFSATPGDPYDDALEKLAAGERAQGVSLAALEQDVAAGRTEPVVLQPVIDDLQPMNGGAIVIWHPVQVGVLYDVGYDLAPADIATQVPVPANTFPSTESPSAIFPLTNGQTYFAVVTAHNGTGSLTSTYKLVTPHAVGLQYTALPDTVDPHYRDTTFGPAATQGAYLKNVFDGGDEYVTVRSSKEAMISKWDPGATAPKAFAAPAPTGDAAPRTVLAMAAGEGRVVAAGESGVVLVYDGRSWSELVPTLAPAGVPAIAANAVEYHSVAFGAHRFVLAGRYPTAAGHTADLLVTLDYSNFAVDCDACPSGPVVTTYASTALSSQTGLNAVSWGNGTFVAIGGSSGLPATNADDFANTVLSDGSAITYASPDGLTWTKGTVPPNQAFSQQILSLPFWNGSFWGMGPFSGALSWSSDGLKWSSAQSTSIANPGHNPHVVAYGDGLFSTCSDDGNSYTSSNGRAWQLHTYGCNASRDTVSWVVFGGLRFVAFAERQMYVSQ